MHIASREIPYKLFLFRARMTLAILQKNNFQYHSHSAYLARAVGTMYIIFEGLESCLDDMKISEKRFCTTFQCRRYDSIIKVYSWFIARENKELYVNFIRAKHFVSYVTFILQSCNGYQHIPHHMDNALRIFGLPSNSFVIKRQISSLNKNTNQSAGVSVLPLQTEKNNSGKYKHATLLLLKAITIICFL